MPARPTDAMLEEKRLMLLPLLEQAVRERLGEKRVSVDLAVVNGGFVLHLGRGRRTHTRGILSAGEVFNHRWREIALQKAADHIDGYADLLNGES